MKPRPSLALLLPIMGMLPCPVAIDVASDKFPVKIERLENGVVMAQTYVPPQLDFRVTRGVVEEGEILNSCKETTREHSWHEHSDGVVVLTCERGVEMELKGIYLGGR